MMSVRSWNTVAWTFAIIWGLFVAIGMPVDAKAAALILAVLARGVADILKAIEGRGK